MGWRILQITKPCYLSVKNSQLRYVPDEGEPLFIPLEDISVLILESKQISFNNALISEMANRDIVMFSCDESHLPSGLFFPFHQHSRYSEIAWNQIDMSEPLKKRLWQEVVKQKILNQSSILSLFNCDNVDKLKEIAKTVLSGDTKNAEAFAANLYWKSLWENFNRHEENDIRNSALNYTYAIVRGCLARSVVGAGLLPCFGIHHANKLNQFNLVDDLMEPFRPFADFIVKKIDLPEKMTSVLKNHLLEVLTQNTWINHEETGFLKSCEITATSFVRAVKMKDIDELELPQLKKLPLFD